MPLLFSVTFQLLLLSVLLPNEALAQPSLESSLPPIENPEQYQLPADMSRVHFYLITVDVGDSVWDNFGHTALRMLDENSNTDRIFNWGYFSLNGGVASFSYNFFKGIMNYSLVTNSPGFEFAQYRRQERSVWQDKINLTSSQKETLYRRLQWNLETENLIYPYQYFFDNCTTKVRDYLDEALGGAIRSSFDGVTDSTFRDQVRAHYASSAVIDFSLDILMNSNIDRPMSEWENMFLPLNFRQRLRQLPSNVAEEGEKLKLLTSPQAVIEFAPPRADSDVYKLVSMLLLIPTLFLFLMLKKIPRSYFATHSRLGLKIEGVNFRLLGLLGLVTASFSGVYGTLMLGSWFVSDHIDLHHNLNLLLFWPTDLLGLLVGLRWLLFCKPWPTNHNSAPFINYYLLAHIVGMLVYAVIGVFGFSAQTLSDVLTYVVPGFLLFTVLIWLIGFEPARPKTSFF
ncbi:MAG: DUF4105 domain-containing protein [Pseudohongiellaceae bacterium]